MTKASLVFVLLLSSQLVFWVLANEPCDGHGYVPKEGEPCKCTQFWVGDDCSIPVRKLEWDVPQEITTDFDNYPWFGYTLPANTLHRIKVSFITPLQEIGPVLRAEAIGVTVDFHQEWTTWDDYPNMSLTIPRLPVETNITGYVAIGDIVDETFIILISKHGELCPNDCSGHGRCDNNLGLCACDTDWTGLSCSEYLPLVSPGPHQVIVPDRFFLYYYLNIPQQTTELTIKVWNRPESATAVYLRRGLPPTQFKNDYQDYSLDQNLTITLPNPDSSTRLYLGFLRSTPVTNFTLEAFIKNEHGVIGCSNLCSGYSHGYCLNVTSDECQCDANYSGSNCGDMTGALKLQEQVSGLIEVKQWNYYHLLPNTTGDLLLHINHVASQNCDLYVKLNSKPTIDDFTYRNISFLTTHELVIPTKGLDEWYIGVYGFTFCEYNLVTKLITIDPCPDSCTNNGGHCIGNTTVCSCNNPLKGGVNCTENVAPSPRAAN